MKNKEKKLEDELIRESSLGERALISTLIGAGVGIGKALAIQHGYMDVDESIATYFPYISGTLFGGSCFLVSSFYEVINRLKNYNTLKKHNKLKKND